MRETSSRRGTLRSGLAVLGAATLLVVGADMVSFAATGDSVILGKTNKANKTTTIQNTGNGPALKLKTKNSKPPLSVTSKKLVKKLNADMVDGKDSKTLDPTVTRYSTGTDGTTMPSPQNLFQISLAAGTYEMSMHGLYLYDGASATYFLQCLVVDRTLFDDPTPNYTKLYLLDSAQQTASSNFDPVLADQQVVTVASTVNLVYGCAGDPDFVHADSLDLTIRKVNKLASGTGTPTTIGPRGVNRLGQVR